MSNIVIAAARIMSISIPSLAAAPIPERFCNPSGFRRRADTC